MKKIILLFLLFAFNTAMFAQNNFDYKILEPVVYQSEVNVDTIQFVDIRTPKEYHNGAIEGAENIDFLAEDFLPKMEKFNREKPLYIYCRSGNRSSKAATELAKIGFENIIDLKGGYNEWQDFETK